MDEELIDSIYAMQILAVTVEYYLLNLLFHLYFLVDAHDLASYTCTKCHVYKHGFIYDKFIYIYLMGV